VDVRQIWLLQAVSMEKERLKRDLTDNEDSIKTLQASLKKQADDCSMKQEGLGGIISLKGVSHEIFRALF
jgi:hypothetical protein